MTPRWDCWEESSTVQRATMFCSRDFAGKNLAFEARKGWHFSYAGLHCVVIKGFSKSAGYQPGFSFDDHRFRLRSLKNSIAKSSETRGMLATWMAPGDLCSVIGEQDTWCKFLSLCICLWVLFLPSSWITMNLCKKKSRNRRPVKEHLKNNV